MNARLRTAINAAKQVNLPKDKIEAAIAKGTGEAGGAGYEEVSYEGYGPGGVAILVEVATDNRNRTVAEIRHILSKNGGSMGESGCVAWMFDKKGVITFDKTRFGEDQMLEIALEAGAEDVRDEGDIWEVRTAPEDVASVEQAFEDTEHVPDSAELSMVPQNLVSVDLETGQKILKLLELLDDHDDVQKVHSNVDIPEELMAEAAQ